jgi:hypothetical protein
MREASKIGIGGTSDLSQLEKMVELMERARKVMGKDS